MGILTGKFRAVTTLCVGLGMVPAAYSQTASESATGAVSAEKYRGAAQSALNDPSQAQAVDDFMQRMDELFAPNTTAMQMERFMGDAQAIAKSSTVRAMQDIKAKGYELGVLPENTTPAEALAAAEGVALLPAGYRASILVSTSMGEGALKDLFAKYRYRKDVRFIFRGVPEGETIPSFALWLKQIAAPDDAEIHDLNIVLDPQMFALADAQFAPTLVIEDLNAADSMLTQGKDLGKIVAKAVGLTDVHWMYEEMTKGRPEFTSQNVSPIIEEDLIERAKREAAAIARNVTTDPEALRNRYWSNLSNNVFLNNIPPATEDRERELHFIARTESNILDSEGNIIAYAGEIFQPQDVVPFDRRVFVFNPNRSAEVDFVEQELATYRDGVNQTLLIASQVPDVAPGADPWEGLQELVTRFGRRVFVLNEQFVASFKIEGTPTEIYPIYSGDRSHVISQEYVVK
jgi:hypothetical protein